MEKNTTTVRGLIKGISEELQQKSASKKDEVRVMKEMLNDFDYEVGVFGKEGLQECFCPAEVAREVISSVISSAASIPAKEAMELAHVHEFSNSEAEGMVSISKEFVNTYMETGRKLPLGQREFHETSLYMEEVEAGTRVYPKKVGVDSEGKGIYEKRETEVKAHKKIKAESKCPSYL